MKAVRLSAKARADFHDIVVATAEQWGDEQAERYALGLTAAIERLAEHPDRYPVAGPRWPGVWRLRAGRHILFFREAARSVMIIRILHERMDHASRL